jgi:uncharacterized protein
LNLCFVKAINYLHPALEVYNSDKTGRGVYAATAIPAKTIIEVSPVIVMSGKDRLNLDKTLLHDYIFEWGDDEKECCMALGYVPLYNHSYAPNCDYEMNFKKQLITVKTIRSVKKREELVFNYNGDKEKNKPLWFAVK